VKTEIYIGPWFKGRIKEAGLEAKNFHDLLDPSNFSKFTHGHQAISQEKLFDLAERAGYLKAKRESRQRVA
jgi:hypothetical protein